MSYIVNYIKDNKIIDLEAAFNRLSIKVKIENNLAIFSYDINADFSDPIVQEARGIIIDINTLEVVCWPFRKFGNYNEYYADKIDWSTARVQEKIDGSIIKLWYYNNRWNWSTNNTIYAENALANNVTNHTFLDLIYRAVNYNNINFDELNRNYTYIFELVSPENQIVIRYNEYKLYHLGTRNNKTGEELFNNINIERPKEYNIKTFTECLNAVSKFNTDGNILHEGFVVVDNGWNRIKVKSLQYITTHHIISNSLSKKAMIKLLITNEDISFIDNKYPQYKVYFSYYKFKLDELLYNIDKFILYTRQLYEEYSHDRKAVALIIKDNKYASFGFKSLNNNISAEDLFNNINLDVFCKYIDDYKEEKIF